jgi:hypothetical protein
MPSLADNPPHAEPCDVPSLAVSGRHDWSSRTAAPRFDKTSQTLPADYASHRFASDKPKRRNPSRVLPID